MGIFIKKRSKSRVFHNFPTTTPKKSLLYIVTKVLKIATHTYKACMLNHNTQKNAVLSKFQEKQLGFYFSQKRLIRSTRNFLDFITCYGLRCVKIWCDSKICLKKITFFEPISSTKHIFEAPKITSIYIYEKNRRTP